MSIVDVLDVLVANELFEARDLARSSARIPDRMAAREERSDER